MPDGLLEGKSLGYELGYKLGIAEGYGVVHLGSQVARQFSNAPSRVQRSHG